MTQLNLIVISIKGFFVAVRLRRYIMERSNKIFVLVTILTCILILSGCNKARLSTNNTDEEEAGSQITIDQDENQIPTDKIKNSEDEVTIPDEVEPTESASDVRPGIQPVANTELMIYTIDSNSGDIEPDIALIPEGNAITPELIVTTAVESMADQSLKVGIEKVSTEGDAVIVSFYSDQPPLMDVGGGIETAILNALAQSLLDNLDDYSKVIYRVEGNAYSSDHIELGVDEVYLSEN